MLPRHQPEYNKRHLNTTQKSDYQYPFEWLPTTKTVMNIILHLINGLNPSHFRTLLLMIHTFIIEEFPSSQILMITGKKDLIFGKTIRISKATNNSHINSLCYKLVHSAYINEFHMKDES